MVSQAYNVSTTSTVPTAVANRVLRNTYALLGMLFVFGSGTAWLAQMMNWRMGFLPFVVGIFAFSFIIARTRNSMWGLVTSFGFAGFLGIVTGANVNVALHQYSNGGHLVAAAFGLTAAIFFALSAYAMTTKRDFSGWFAFLGVGTLARIGTSPVHDDRSDLMWLDHLADSADCAQWSDQLHTCSNRVAG